MLLLVAFHVLGECSGEKTFAVPVHVRRISHSAHYCERLLSTTNNKEVSVGCALCCTFKLSFDSRRNEASGPPSAVGKTFGTGPALSRGCEARHGVVIAEGGRLEQCVLVA